MLALVRKNMFQITVVDHVRLSFASILARKMFRSLAFMGILVYLTVEKLGGEPIGRRPLLLLGVLLVVVGIQFLSLGLLSELVTSQHRERSRAADDRPSRLVDEILR